MTGRPSGAAGPAAGGRPTHEPDWPGVASAVVTLLAELAAAEPDAGHDPAFCQVCPLCRLMTRLRAVRPDLADQLTGAAAGVESALRALLAPAVPVEVAVPPAPPVAGAPDVPGLPDHPPAWPSTVRPPVERIEVTG